MKKIISICVIVMMMAAMLTGCTSTKEEDVTIKIAGLTGPTTMGLVKLMDNNEQKTAANTYEFTVAGSADEITPKLIQGELDMAAVPANLASVLYNNSEGKVEVLAINTLGVLYVVESGNQVQSVADLKGKTIYATGKGSTPEYTLRYLLSANGIDPDKDVTIEFKSEPTEVVAVLGQEQGAVAMLPQPYVTVAKTKVDGLNVALSLNDLWNDTNNGSMMITGVLVARKDFVENHPKAVETFLEEYKASVDFANSNVEEASTLTEKYGIVKAAIAKQALPECNITYIEGTDMKEALQGYLQTLFDQNPKAVGGTLPADDFYYQK